jgi:hypothetical protein
VAAIRPRSSDATKASGVNMRRVIVESPFAGKPGRWQWWHRWRNRAYARRCLADCLARGEAPFASHLIYPQVLNDGVANERALGIAAGLAWGAAAEATVVYVDRGVSGGMRQGIAAAKAAGRVIEYRSLDLRKKGF